MATSTKKPKATKASAPVAQTQQPTPQAVAAPAACDDVLGMVGNVQTVQAKSSKDKTPEFKCPADLADTKGKGPKGEEIVVPGKITQFLTQKATAKSAENAAKTLGTAIRPPLETLRIAESRKAKVFLMAINIDSSLTFIAGNLDVVGVKDPKEAGGKTAIEQIQEMKKNLTEIFGEDGYKKYFCSDHVFSMVKRMPDAPETLEPDAAQRQVVAELQQRLGADFNKFFTLNPCLAVVKAKEGSALLADATLDPVVEEKLKKAKDNGLISQDTHTLKARAEATAGKGK